MITRREICYNLPFTNLITVLQVNTTILASQKQPFTVFPSQYYLPLFDSKPLSRSHKLFTVSLQPFTLHPSQHHFPPKKLHSFSMSIYSLPFRNYHILYSLHNSWTSICLSHFWKHQSVFFSKMSKKHFIEQEKKNSKNSIKIRKQWDPVITATDIKVTLI